MAGPAAVVVAGLVTVWLAARSADGLVADDYYKRGLAINQELKREHQALESGVVANVEARDGRLRVRLDGTAPEAIFVRLVHATRAGYDQRLRLTPTVPGLYDTELPELPAGRWRVIVEDARGTWRIVKEGL